MNGTCARATPSRGAAPTAPSSRPRSPSCSSPRSSSGCAAEEVGPGEIIAIAGIPEITIGETLADLDDPRPLPVIHIDEPSLSMTIGINTSPLAGKEGTQLTARLVKGRLDRELVGNVSIHVLPTERPDTWEVQGRGELQLAVLVEMMRREGFELTVGKPQVLTKEIDGKVHEPVDRLTIDVPEDYLGVVTQLLALRKGRMEQIINHGTGWVRMEYLVPARGLIGFRTEFITETRGTGLLHHVFERMEPWAGEIKGRPNGSLVADRLGPTTGFALTALQDRGVMFVGPGVPVYEGMIVGENSPRRRHGHQPHQGEEAQQHPVVHGRGVREADPAPHAVPRAGPRADRRGRVRRGDPASRCACARSSSTRPTRARSGQASQDRRLTKRQTRVSSGTGGLTSRGRASRGRRRGPPRPRRSCRRGGWPRRRRAAGRPGRRR